MYALARNSWKFQNRDTRIRKVQHIEFEPFAPDTIEEIFTAVSLLEKWTAKAYWKVKKIPTDDIKDIELEKKGRELLSGDENFINDLEVLGENMEHSKRKVLILKPWKAYFAYKDILHYYAVTNILSFFRAHADISFSGMCNELKGKRDKEWVNMGGQIMKKTDLDKIRSDIGTGKLSSWVDIHNRYDELWENYPLDKQKHAYASLCELYGKDQLTRSDWNLALKKALEIQQFICDQVYVTRKKDYDNPFRQITFRNEDEMKATIGDVDNNSFILQVKKETSDLKKYINKIKKMAD